MFIRLRIYLHVTMSLILCIQALENIALHKKATMSTQRTADSGANGAVDGNTAQAINSASCALTALDRAPEAWWRVDLNGTYAISELKIYLLNTDIYRFRFYSVHLTDDLTDWRSSPYCARDHHTGDGPSSSVFTLNCDGKGRYLTIWLNRHLDCASSTQKEINFCDILQLCEVQLFGCYPGNYSQNCNMTCPVNCRDDLCSIDAGLCYECKDGYLGNTCVTECEPKKFGRKCLQECNGNCRDGKTCSHINGYCPSGCMDGYIGAYCNNTCPDGYFGFNCTLECGNCLNNKTCVPTNGICVDDCASGWNGSYCNTSCDAGRYGVNCYNMCSEHCKNRSDCDKFTGTCMNGCKDGWRGRICDKECEYGNYGSDCLEVCGKCYQNDTCDHVNGVCQAGCDRGWKGTYCKTGCPDGTYGFQCEGICSNNCNTMCNKTTGQCDKGCIGGWEGLYCNKSCDQGSYGPDCVYNCSGNCKGNDSCSIFDGSCPNGCGEGWRSDTCHLRCMDGTYGEDCLQRCGGCNNQTVCNITTGVCDSGCMEGYQEPYCKRNETKEQAIIMPPKDPPVIPLVSGITIATIVIVIVLVILLILRRRRLQGTKSEQQTSQPMRPMKSVYENVSATGASRTRRQSSAYADVQFEVDTEDGDFLVVGEARSSAVYSNTTKFVNDIPVSDLSDIIEKKSLNKNKVFSEEFEALPKGLIEKCDVAKQPQNISKNRYKTTFAYDHSRIILKSKDGDDYINANYLDGILSTKEYIASQGPKQSTFRDHWCMIWQEKVEKIVMLTNLVENRKIKCDQYWPNEDNSTLNAGEFNVSIVSEQVYACYTIRKLTVTNEDLNESRYVTHYHFTTWLDHGVPDALELVLFHIRVNTTETRGPLLVHCSAGIGRTGTYIALDALMDSCRESGTINVFEYVQLMRNNRVGMIQNLNQYIVVHSAVFEHLRTVHHNISKATFADDVTIKLNSEQRDDFEEEFKVIESMKPNYGNEDFKAGLSEKNSSKNFSKDILPVDAYAAFLPSNVKGQVDYINAVYVPSYTDHHGFIVTQIPTYETDSDFLSLLFDHYVTTVVVLLANDLDITKCSWLSCTKIQTPRGLLKLQVGDITSPENDIEERAVTVKRNTLEVFVQVLSIQCLKEEEIDSTKLHALIKLASLLKTRSDDHGQRTVLMSQDGVMGCGVLLTLYNAIQQLQLDSEVDIPTIVRRMKVRRPQLCSNLSEYMLCYRIVAEYLIETNVYANN